ncbi:unnamed protein product [Owenia fusiformis]|uniref:Uncharacterized protein n=1 Tax=Owenia fusiformis TaxID=6347 RepID=A0A8J1TBT8_OWEFU|nr:unnamed protein product [Owenia fusiformis]
MDLKLKCTLTLEQSWILILLSFLMSNAMCGQVRNQRLGCFAEEESPTLALFCPEGQFLRIVSSKFGLSRFRLCFRIVHDCVEEGSSLEGCCGQQSCQFTVNRRYLQTCGGSSSYYQVLYECVDYIQDAGCRTTTVSTISLPPTTSVPTRRWPTTTPHPFNKFLHTNRSTVRVTISNVSNTPRHRTSIAKIIEFLSNIVNRNSTQATGQSTILSNLTTTPAPPVRVTNVPPFWNTFLKTTVTPPDDHTFRTLGRTVYTAYPIKTTTPSIEFAPTHWSNATEIPDTQSFDTESEMKSEQVTLSGQPLVYGSTEPGTKTRDMSLLDFWRSLLSSKTTTVTTTATITTTSPAEIDKLTQVHVKNTEEQIFTSPSVNTFETTSTQAVQKEISSQYDISDSTQPTRESTSGLYSELAGGNEDTTIDMSTTSVILYNLVVTNTPDPIDVSKVKDIATNGLTTIPVKPTTTHIATTVSSAKASLTSPSYISLSPRAPSISTLTLRTETPTITLSPSSSTPITEETSSIISPRVSDPSSSMSEEMNDSYTESPITASTQPNQTQNRVHLSMNVSNISDSLNTIVVRVEKGPEIVDNTSSQTPKTSSEEYTTEKQIADVIGNNGVGITPSADLALGVTTDSYDDVYFETSNDLLEENNSDDFEFADSDLASDADDFGTSVKNIPNPCGQIADDDEGRLKKPPDHPEAPAECYNPEHGESTSYSQNTLIGIACAEALVFLALMLVLMLYLRRRYLAKSVQWAEKNKRGFSFGALIRPTKPFEDRFDPENGCTVLDDCPPIKKHLASVRPAYNDTIFRFEPDWVENDPPEERACEAVIKCSTSEAQPVSKPTRTKPKAPKPPRRTTSHEIDKSILTVSDENSGADSGVTTDHEEPIGIDEIEEEANQTGQSKGRFNNVMMELLQTIPLKDEYVVRSNHRHQFGIRGPPKIPNNDSKTEKQRIRKPPRSRQHSAPNSNRSSRQGNVESKSYLDNDIDNDELFYDDKTHKTIHKSFEELDTTREQFENIVNKLFDKVDEPPYINTVIENGRVKILGETCDKHIIPSKQTQNVKFKDSDPTSTANGALKDILDSKRSKKVKSCLKSNKKDRNEHVIDGYAPSNVGDEAHYSKVPQSHNLMSTQEPRFVVNIYGSSESLEKQCRSKGVKNNSKIKRSRNSQDKKVHKNVHITDEVYPERNTELINLARDINDSKRILNSQALTML